MLYSHLFMELLKLFPLLISMKLSLYWLEAKWCLLSVHCIKTLSPNYSLNISVLWGSDLASLNFSSQLFFPRQFQAVPWPQVLLIGWPFSGPNVSAGVQTWMSNLASEVHHDKTTNLSWIPQTVIYSVTPAKNLGNIQDFPFSLIFMSVVKLTHFSC